MIVFTGPGNYVYIDTGIAINKFMDTMCNESLTEQLVQDVGSIM